jgi:zinc resistance-associated protein
MKRLSTILGIVALIGMLTVPALAYGPGYGKKGGRGSYGDDRGYPGACRQGAGPNVELTADQKKQLGALYQKHYDDTAAMKTELWAKRGQFRILMNTSNPDIGKLKALQKEISEIQAQLAEKGLEYQLEARKIAPELRYQRGFGRGHGKGFKARKGGRGGYGRGQGGYGEGRGAYGGGPCWQ